MSSYLSSEVPTDSINYVATMQKVKQHHGRGFVRQLFEIAVLAHGPGKIHPAEYFRMRLYHPSLSLGQKLRFLGRAGNFRLCEKLAPAGLDNLDGVLRNKWLSGRMFASIGLPCPRERAVFPGVEEFEPVRNLPGVEAIRAFLMDPANLPVHGKPTNSSRGLGQISLFASPDGAPGPHLSEGTPIEATALAQEISTRFPDGFVFQDVAEVDPQLKVRLGAGTTVRLVTLDTSQGVVTLYAMLIVRTVDERGALVPASAKFTLFDLDTGTISPAPGLPADVVDGACVPHAERMDALARRAHECLGIPGMIGWDVIPTSAGPMFLEANTRPFNDSVQILMGQGLMGPAFRSLLEDARSHAQSRLKDNRVGVGNALRRHL